MPSRASTSQPPHSNCRQHPLGRCIRSCVCICRTIDHTTREKEEEALCQEKKSSSTLVCIGGLFKISLFSLSLLSLSFSLSLSPLSSWRTRERERERDARRMQREMTGLDFSARCICLHLCSLREGFFFSRKYVSEALHMRSQVMAETH